MSIDNFNKCDTNSVSIKLLDLSYFLHAVKDAKRRKLECSNMCTIVVVTTTGGKYEKR